MHFNSPNMSTSRRQDAEPRTKLIETLTVDFTEQLRSQFAFEISCDPKAFKALVIRLFRKHLPLRRGRPNDPRIDTAMRLIAQGKTINEVLRSQISGFEKLDAYGRYLAEKGLRGAIARRHKRKQL